MNAVAAKKEKAPKAAKAAAPKKTATKGGTVEARLYDVIVRPIVTEKSTRAVEQNKVVFKISPRASKKDVKRAVEALFGVTVKKVNTIKLPGKTKSFRGSPGQRSDLRKAIVTLEAGQSIDFSGGAR